jgi:phospholipid-transporting ATPase
MCDFGWTLFSTLAHTDLHSGSISFSLSKIYNLLIHPMLKALGLKGNGAVKPESLPEHWPNPSEQDLKDRPQRVIQVGREQAFVFKDNFVKTSKYEPWNFLPKFIMEVFNPRTKIANCYFLLIACLQTIPEISNTAGVPTTLAPLTFVVVVDAIFSIMEDIARHRADAEANSSEAFHYSSEQRNFVSTKWSDLKVGDFIRIPNRATIPADVLILAVAEKHEPAQGLCYVETKSLDGETNLKIRNAMPNTLNKIKDVASLSTLQGEITMEHPNKLIDSFTGVLDLNGLGREAIQKNNVLLRGCVLRNTDWIMGLVVNTGHDTKIMMSAMETTAKTSTLESKASNEIKKIVGLLALVCFIGTTGALIWNSQANVSDMYYLDWNPNPAAFWFIQFFYFFLLHATFIPVSLYVSMTLVRFFQSGFMNADLEMYYEKTDTPALVRTMPLNEELGQISHVFSDKTGTLTCNVMDFRKASINGVSYGLGITEIGKASWKLQGKEIPPEVLEGEEKAKANAVPHVSFYDPRYDEDILKPGLQKKAIQYFYRILALCHDVIPERVDGKIKLSASNPDDEALVCAAAYFGFEFRDNREGRAVIWNKEANREEEIQVLDVIEFSSKRKRMSVIVKDTDGAIRILTKGADSTMISRLRDNQDTLLDRTDAHMRQYAVEGLRCLIVGYSDLPEKKYREWHTEYKAAATDINELDKRKAGLANEIERLEDVIEQDLVLVGCTAIEDRLQDGVPECIETIAKAGINIWVLTGDKEETAINIAVACNLVLPKQYMRHIIINKSTTPSRESTIKLIQDEIMVTCFQLICVRLF